MLLSDNMSVTLSGDTDGDFYSGSNGTHAHVRDVFAKRDLGNFTATFTTPVAPTDGRLFRLTFHS